jgi:flagellar secretion chaperone FliS
MSYNVHTAARYLEADVMTRSAQWLVPLMYEHLLACLKRAAVQIEASDFAGKAESLTKASAIVFELLASLDFEKGGELASRLAALYAYFAREITAVGRSLDAEHLTRLIAMIEGLHESWVRAAEATSPRSGRSYVAPEHLA